MGLFDFLRGPDHKALKDQAKTFLSENSQDKDVIPLCGIAVLYAPDHQYERSVYRNFMDLSRDVQNMVLSMTGAKITLDDNLPSPARLQRASVHKLIRETERNFPHDDVPFHHDGKFIEFALTRYGNQRPPETSRSYEKQMVRRIHDAVRNDTDGLIDHLNTHYKFGRTNDIKTAQYVTMLAQYMAVYEDKETQIGSGYRSPLHKKSGHDRRMEDLYLTAMYETYTRLM